MGRLEGDPEPGARVPWGYAVVRRPMTMAPIAIITATMATISAMMPREPEEPAGPIVPAGP